MPDNTLQAPVQAPVDPRVNALGVQPFSPIGGVSPQAIQAAYLKKLLEKQQGAGGGGQQQPIRSWTQVAAGIADTLADQMQLNRMMGQARAGTEAGAEALFPGDGGHATPDGAAASAPAGGSPVQSTADSNDPAFTPAMTISSLGETSRTGAAALSNISPDSAGSKSYGPWGLNSKTGSAAQFAAANPHLGITAQPGTPEFDQQWRNASTNNKDAMLQAHQNWYSKNILGGAKASMAAAGVNPAIAGDPRVQAYMADRTLQMGHVGLNRVLASGRGATSPEDFIHQVSASDHANLGNDFHTYLSDYPTHTKGLGNRIDWRQSAAMTIGGGQGGGQPAIPGAPSAMAFNGTPQAGGAPPIGGPPPAPGAPMGQPSPGGVAAGGAQPSAPVAAPAAPGAAPVLGGQPPLGAPAATPAATPAASGASPGASPLEPREIQLPQTAIPFVQKMTREQAKQAWTAAQNRGDSAGANQIHQDYLKQFQPVDIPWAGGTARYNPTTGKAIFTPTLEKGVEKLPGGIERPHYSVVTPQGISKLPIASPQGQAPAGAPAINELPENATPGQAQEFVRKGELLKEGQKEIQTEAGKVYSGVSGLGTTGGKIQSITRDLMPIVSDPKWSEGGGLGETRLAIGRLATSLGLDANAAAPREVVNQAVGLLKNYMQEALKSGTSVLGEQSPRIFQTEVATIEKILPDISDSQAGLKAKLSALDRLGKHWRDNADEVDKYVNGQPGKIPDQGINKILRDRSAGFHMLVPEEAGVRAPEQKQGGVVTRSIGGKTYYQRDGKWHDSPE